MRTIERNYTDRVDVYGLSNSGNSLVYGLLQNDVPCHIQPLDKSFIQDNTGMFAKSFYIFMRYNTDVKEGVKLVDIETGNTMRVVSVEYFKIAGDKKHMEITARLFDNNAS